MKKVINIKSGQSITKIGIMHEVFKLVVESDLVKTTPIIDGFLFSDKTLANSKPSKSEITKAQFSLIFPFFDQETI